MNRSRLLLIPFAVLPLLAPREAGAQVTRLLMLRNLRQAVESTYQLKANQGEVSSSTENALQEDYRIGIDYAVYRPRLLHGEVNLDVRANQNLYSGNDRGTNGTYGFGLLYDINGIFLDRLPYPLSFSYSSNTVEVPREFASSYSLTTDNLALQLPVASQVLPIFINYNRNTSSTDGLELDSETRTETYTFGATHNLKDSQTFFTISGTTLDLTADSEGLQHSSNIDANLNNNLDLSSGGLSRMLYTRAHVVTQRGVNESRTTDLSAALNWALGRALESGANYAFSLREEPSLLQRNHNAHLWLQHQLFRSLLTRVEIEGTERSLGAGGERSGGVGGSLNYRKLLPGASRIQITAGKYHLVTSNQLENGDIGVFAEQQTVNEFYLVLLNQENVAPGSIEVWNESRTLRYTEGLDYEVHSPAAGRTEIAVLPSTSRISRNDRLSIDYQVLVNSDITYSTTRNSLGADLTMREGKYRLFASWDDTSQKLISGSTDQVNLSGATSYRTGFEARQEESGTFLFEYSNISSSAEDSQTYKAAFMRSGSWRQGRYNLNATDRYLIRQSKLTGRVENGSDSSNTFSASGSYTTVLENAVQLTATANYLNTIGYIDSNHLALGLDLRWRMRRLSINAISQANFRYSSGMWSSDQNLLIRLSRQF